METITRIRRPLIDVNPDAPLKFHGCRIARDGSVYASTSPAVHGRMNPNYEVIVGSVRRWKNGCWVAISDYLDEALTASRQSDAAKKLVDAVERSQ